MKNPRQYDWSAYIFSFRRLDSIHPLSDPVFRIINGLFFKIIYPIYAFIFEWILKINLKYSMNIQEILLISMENYEVLRFLEYGISFFYLMMYLSFINSNKF
jgi:hypothetical protein